jgi:hypothetical protein
MVVDSERNGACWSKPGDPRITSLGRILRKLHLDELPQLWNVVCGEMRLIGPRPERPEFIPELADQIPHYCDRLQVPPGITGFAQVQLPADINLGSVRAKIAYDLWYIKNRSIGLEIRILAATALKMVGLSYETLRWLMCFPSCRAVERMHEMVVASRVRWDDVTAANVHAHRATENGHLASASRMEHEKLVTGKRTRAAEPVEVNGDSLADGFSPIASHLVGLELVGDA